MACLESEKQWAIGLVLLAGDLRHGSTKEDYTALCRALSGRLNGISWAALPRSQDDRAPDFHPEFLPPKAIN